VLGVLDDLEGREEGPVESAYNVAIDGASVGAFVSIDS
jgi:hypothetical protein